MTDTAIPPLHQAAWAGRCEAVRELLEKGADVHAVLFEFEGGLWDGPGTYENLTALHLAIGGGHAEVVAVLLDAGAEPEAIAIVSQGGEVSEYTAVDLAYHLNNEAVAKTLVERCARALGLTTPFNPASPLLRALDRRDWAATERLTRAAAPADGFDSQGRSALILAIEKNAPDGTLERLIAAGAPMVGLVGHQHLTSHPRIQHIWAKTHPAIPAEPLRPSGLPEAVRRERAGADVGRGYDD